MATIDHEVHIRIDCDEEARKVQALLESCGYEVRRDLSEHRHALGWILDRVARRCCPGLTPRERDILVLVLNGRSNQQITKELEVSRATVKWHVHNIFAKTSTSDREGLLRLALECVA